MTEAASEVGALRHRALVVSRWVSLPGLVAGTATICLAATGLIGEGGDGEAVAPWLVVAASLAASVALVSALIAVALSPGVTLAVVSLRREDNPGARGALRLALLSMLGVLGTWFYFTSLQFPWDLRRLGVPFRSFFVWVIGQ